MRKMILTNLNASKIEFIKFIHKEPDFKSK